MQSTIKSFKGYILFVASFLIMTIFRMFFEGMPFATSLDIVLFSFLVIGWFSSLWDRLVVKRDWICMALIASNMILLMLFTTLKYYAFGLFDEYISRHLWYAYYIPVTAIPLLSFYISRRALHDDREKDSVNFVLLGILWIGMVLLIMANDGHQMMFRFDEGFKNWNDDYSYGFMYYLVVFWIVFLQASSFAIIFFKSSFPNVSKKKHYVIIPVVLGCFYFMLIFFRMDIVIGNIKPFSFSNVYVMTLIGVYEGCMRMGLIPSNDYYEDFFINSSASAVILDERGRRVFATKGSGEINKGRYDLEEPLQSDDSKVLSRFKVDGGYVITAQDVSRINELRKELEEARDSLDQESLIIRNENELKKEYASLKVRNELYDNLSSLLSPQLMKIDNYLNGDDDFIDNLSKVCVLGTYIKRRSNLAIIAQENKRISIFEFVLSVNESIEYLRLNGIKASIYTTAVFELDSEALIALYELYEEIIEVERRAIETIYIEVSDKRIMFMYTSDCLMNLSEAEKLKPFFDVKAKREDRDTTIILTVSKEDSL